MKSRRLGKSPIFVSDICMGTMTFGSHADEETAIKVPDQSYEAGINFYDTAENYPVPPDPKYAGVTEEIFGRWLKTKGPGLDHSGHQGQRAQPWLDQKRPTRRDDGT